MRVWGRRTSNGVNPGPDELRIVHRSTQCHHHFFPEIKAKARSQTFSHEICRCFKVRAVRPRRCRAGKGGGPEIVEIYPDPLASAQVQHQTLGMKPKVGATLTQSTGTCESTRLLTPVRIPKVSSTQLAMNPTGTVTTR